MPELFDENNRLISFPIDRGDLAYHPGFLSPAECPEIIDKLRNEINWKQETVRIFGKSFLTLRLTAWYGDAEATYSYSGLQLNPEPWTPLLTRLKDRIMKETGSRFNAVLLNFYRDGNDSMGWHADDEKELGFNPVIASLSLGQDRSLRFRRKENHRESFSVSLANGSLLVMGGEIQKFWQHALPRSARQLEERINLTFRLIRPV